MIKSTKIRAKIKTGMVFRIFRDFPQVRGFFAELKTLIKFISQRFKIYVI